MFTAVGFGIFCLALALAAITFCILLHRHSGNSGWLFLGVLFVEPLYHFGFRLSKGLPLFWYQTSQSVGPDDIKIQEFRSTFQVPIFYICAVIGLFLLYRKARRKTPSA
jgi:hypothetical protein